jgi:hypothetical protein
MQGTVRVCLPSRAVSIPLEYFPIHPSSVLIFLLALALFIIVPSEVLLHLCMRP